MIAQKITSKLKHCLDGSCAIFICNLALRCLSDEIPCLAFMGFMEVDKGEHMLEMLLGSPGCMMTMNQAKNNVHVPTLIY